jgi:RNA polymerase sigma-70 factor, ECF subfamily
MAASISLADTIPDEDLVRRCQFGEEEAFSLLYERYRRPVLSTAARIIRNFDEAQEITQEIFLKVHRSIADFDPGKAKMSTWLYRLATNHAIDHWRAQRRRHRLEADKVLDEKVMNQIPSPMAQSNPQDSLERMELAGEIRRLTARLPQLQQRLLILRHFHGLTLAEIARIEGRSLGTVKGLLFRACRTLRTRIAHRKIS